MRFLRDVLTLGGAAWIGWAVPNLVVAALPFSGWYNPRSVALYSLLLATGITFVVIGYGVHQRAIFVWLLGCFLYTALVGYFFWRVVTRLEETSYYVLLALIAEWPFAALWWRYAKLYFDDRDDGYQ
jgi:hypothetical protein